VSTKNGLSIGAVIGLSSLRDELPNFARSENALRSIGVEKRASLAFPGQRKFLPLSGALAAPALFLKPNAGGELTAILTAGAKLPQDSYPSIDCRFSISTLVCFCSLRHHFSVASSPEDTYQEAAVSLPPQGGRSEAHSTGILRAGMAQGDRTSGASDRRCAQDRSRGRFHA